MRIGIDARFLGGPSYGLAQYSENLLLSLSSHDEDNEYIVFVNGALNRKLKLRPNFEQVPIPGRPLSAGGLLRLRRALRRSPVDLLHVHFPLAPVGVDCPTLITVHDIVPFSATKGVRRGASVWDRIGGRFLYPMTMRRARWIMCVSNATRDRLVEIFPETFHKTIVLASGVEDIHKRKIEPAAAKLIESRLNIPGEFVLYSGSIGESKNIPRMIQAFAELSRRDPRALMYHFVLDLTGDLSGLQRIQHTIDHYEHEANIHVRTDLSHEERQVLFHEAEALFMVSKNEGFGFPVLRAQLAHVPVVAADDGALPEVCGDGALLVDPDNVGEMAEMLGQALFDENLRDYLIEKGAENAKRYSWDDTSRQVKQIYELLF